MSRKTPLVVSITGWIVLAFIALLLIVFALGVVAGLVLPGVA